MGNVKLNWSKTSKQQIIENIGNGQKMLKTAHGDRYKKISRYVSYMKSALKGKGVKTKVNIIQPRLTNFEQAVEVIDIDDLLTKKILAKVLQDKDLVLKLNNEIINDDIEILKASSLLRATKLIEKNTPIKEGTKIKSEKSKAS